MQQAFRGRKKDPTPNVMVAVNCDLKFTYVLPGWEGSAHDATILADAVAREDGLSLPEGKMFLVDAGYACKNGFLPPYRGVRYHLSEYGPRNRPTNARELYNLRHSSLRVTVERAIGALKGFGIDEVVPDEEGFTTSVDPTNLPPAHLDQDSVDMAEIRDAICNAIPRMDSGAFEGGFVAGTSVMEQLINGGSAPIVAGAGASAAAPVAAGAGAGAAPGAVNPVDVAAPVAGNGAVRAMRWTNTTSGFVLRRMAALVSDGSRPEKVFKDKDVNSMAKALKQFCGEVVSPTQVYNHLRKWRRKWARVSKLKDLSAALWDDQAHAIMLEQEHYLGHCKDHPKDAEFLNCPIRFYTEMEAIFANAMATGKFALRSGEALGQNQADSVGAKADGPLLTHTTVPSEQGGDSKATELLPTSLAASPKRKRGNFSEEEMLILTNMSDAVNNVANALRETGPVHVDANLYLAMMEMPSFSEEALIVAYTFLLDNKAQGGAL
ncbi:uncharacterized protein [Miscanthus floridulus]|uniref:uncharacterized protein n=1 Tax=Miscanthus floridulus TaxID=154761 RepID=UPI0034582A69